MKGMSKLVGSILTIVVAVAIILVVLKLFQSIAKPLMAIIIVVAAALLIFGVVDFSTALAEGQSLIEKFIEFIKSKI